MIELMMYMGIGFLFGGLVGLAVLPLVHGRAVRLTTRRLESALPQSIAEIDADKDLLRADFAMSIRRLEVNLEQVKNKAARQLVELGKKSDVINRLKIQRDALKVEVISLRAQVEAGKERRTAGRRVASEGDFVSYMRQWIPHRIHH